MRPRVLLADDHRLVLGALEALLSQECDVVGTATDGRALVAAAVRLQPDLVVLDVAMPLEWSRRGTPDQAGVPANQNHRDHDE
jgi:DNA-binding NarL/FixJ family response regulator